MYVNTIVDGFFHFFGSVGHVGDHVLVVVAVHRVELAAVLACVGGESGRRERSQRKTRDKDTDKTVKGDHDSS